MDDGAPVEPEYYVPILPFVLVNGISGIGTGFSCSIQPYHPLLLTKALRYKMHRRYEKESLESEFIPYYEGFKGTIESIPQQENKFLVRGVYEKVAEDKIRITELPIGTWTMPYIAFLEGLMDGTTNEKTGKKTPPLIKDFVSVCTELTVDITVQFNRGELAPLLENEKGQCLEKLLKLTSSLSTTNMHLFDADCRLHKYASVEEIIDAFYEIRMTTYQKRKAYLVAELERTLNRISNKAKYIMETLDGAIDLRRKTQMEMDALLESRGYDRLSVSSTNHSNTNNEDNHSFKYLTKMPMDSVSQENVASLLKEKEAKEKEYELLKSTTCEQMWVKELDEFDREYTRFINNKTVSQMSQNTNEKAVKKIKLVKGKLVA